MEIILKISTSKKLVILLFFLSTVSSLVAQDSNEEDFYREDQFYFGSSYFIQTEQVTDFKQNGFSGNFQIGFIRDIPLNKTSTNALGIGLGFERNLFTSNIQALEVDGEIDYDIIVSRFLESKNKISYSSIAIPIEFRWRKSSVDVYRFWRIYSGLKIKKNFSLFSNPSYGKELKIKDIQEWTSSIYFNVGYNTWNISLEYDLNPLIKNQETLDGNTLNVGFFRLGLIFYLL